MSPKDPPSDTNGTSANNPPTICGPCIWLSITKYATREDAIEMQSILDVYLTELRRRLNPRPKKK